MQQSNTQKKSLASCFWLHVGTSFCGPDCLLNSSPRVRVRMKYLLWDTPYTPPSIFLCYDLPHPQ